MTNDKLNELQEKTQGGGRLDEEMSFQERLVKQFDDDSVSNSRKNITTNDPELWDVFQALEKDGERYETFLDNVGIDNPDPPRSVVLSELARAAIREKDPELKEEIDAASAEVDSGF